MQYLLVDAILLYPTSRGELLLQQHSFQMVACACRVDVATFALYNPIQLRQSDRIGATRECQLSFISI